jgi:hypothetical protein
MNVENLHLLLEALSTDIRELRGEMNTRFEGIDRRLCARCEQHDERIRKLERAQAKMLGAAGIAVVVVNAFVRWVWPR